MNYQPSYVLPSRSDICDGHWHALQIRYALGHITVTMDSIVRLEQLVDRMPSVIGPWMGVWATREWATDMYVSIRNLVVFADGNSAPFPDRQSPPPSPPPSPPSPSPSQATRRLLHSDSAARTRRRRLLQQGSDAYVKFEDVFLAASSNTTEAAAIAGLRDSSIFPLRPRLQTVCMKCKTRSKLLIRLRTLSTQLLKLFELFCPQARMILFSLVTTAR